MMQPIDQRVAGPNAEHAAIKQLVADLLMDLSIAMELGVLRAAAEPRLASVFLGTGKYVADSVRRHNAAMRVVVNVLTKGLEHPEIASTFARINAIHREHAVPGEFMLLAFSLLVTEPAIWLNRYGWREMSDVESRAWSNLWTGCAVRMGLANVPQCYREWSQLSQQLTEELSCPGPHAEQLGSVARSVFANRFPPIFRSAANKVFEAVVDTRLRCLLGYSPPTWAARVGTHAIFWIRKQWLRWIPFSRTWACDALPYFDVVASKTSTAPRYGARTEQ